MISNFVRDNSYFQSLFENNTDINSKDLDTEINNLIDFLNKKVVNSINNISTKSYSGIIGNNNYILKNIGNGNVVYDKLKDVNYENNSITFDKINSLKPYSLIYSNINSNLEFLSLNENNNNSGGIFGNLNTKIYEDNIKIEGKNFYDKSIKSNNISPNSIINEHISDNGKLFLLKNIKLENRHIVNNTIGNDKFAYYSISYDKLHQDIRTFREKEDTFLTYENDSITWDKVKINSFDFRLISANLNKFGYGILNKNVVPLNSVLIHKPDNIYTETINTYQLCIYSIANAYQLNTYTVPQPDQIYVNPAYLEKLNLYNSVNQQLIDANIYLNKLYENCIFKTHFISQDMVDNDRGPNNNLFKSESLKYFCIYWKIDYEDLVKQVSNYQAQLKICNNLYINLQKIKIDLENTPKNIYFSTPPTIYQKVEAVPNTKSYILHREQQDIKSRHLKDNMFDISNIPDKITYTNVSNENFINKYMLSPEVRAKLGLVI